MIKSDKKLSELALLLHEEDEEIILHGIEMLREEQPFQGAIGLLTAFYDNTDEILIRKAIAQFMNDLKDQSASVEIISEIKRTWKASTTNMLVASCWQSGLDYSSYSLEFIDMFIQGDYATYFECLTVIEENATALSTEKKREMIEHLRNSSASWPKGKKTLTRELISILER
jgi:hypothetical protein